MREEHEIKRLASLFVRRMVRGKKGRGVAELETKFEGGQCYH